MTNELEKTLDSPRSSGGWPLPGSIVTVVVLGLFVVVMPLIGALINANKYVDSAIERSQEVVETAVIATRDGQTLMDTLVDLERRARQYHVLGDTTLLEVFDRDLVRLEDILKELLATGGAEAEDPAHQITQLLTEMSSTLHGEPFDSEQVKTQLNVFPTLNKKMRALVDVHRGAISDAVAKMRKEAKETRRTLFVIAISLIPVTVVLISLFSFLITRPIRQIDRGISTLGSGIFEQEIRVTGTRDLRALGQRLNWLSQRLSELEQQKTKFLRHMSHELKTPLSSIREASELLSERVPGPLNKAQQEITELLLQNSRYLQRLIEDLLAFAAGSEELQTLQLESVHIRDVVQEVVERNRLAAVAKEIEIVIDGSCSNAVVDRKKIQTAFDNLVSNAVHYSANGAQIFISLRDLSEYIEIEVADGGPGVPEEEQESIFEIFVQGSARRDGHVKGSGIGLAIVKDVLDKHQGSIVVSNREGGGACFCIRIPKNQRNAIK